MPENIVIDRSPDHLFDSPSLSPDASPVPILISDTAQPQRGIIFRVQSSTSGDMPALTSLLRHVSRIQWASFQRSSLSMAERYVWFALSLTGIAWGIVAGASFVGNFTVRPLTGALGSVGVVVLLSTLLTWGRAKGN